MVDVYSVRKRSDIMSRIRAHGSKAELAVRRMTYRLGYRYRLHRRDLPGRPDIVFAKHQKVIFVHGCFWHGHYCRSGQNKPKSNEAYWGPKLERTIQRDSENRDKLVQMGWQVLIVWECELRDSEQLSERVKVFLAAEES